MKGLLIVSFMTLSVALVPLMSSGELVEMSDEEMSDVYVKGVIPSAAKGKGEIDPKDLDAIKDQIAAKNNVDGWLSEDAAASFYYDQRVFLEDFIIDSDRLLIELQNELLKQELEASPFNPASP